jgi:hypothetical protein
MVQKLINALNSVKGTQFISFTYTNKQGEKATRLIQLNTSYANALTKDLHIIPSVEYVQNDKFDLATFETAKVELLKSCKLSLGISDESISKVEAEKHSNRSNGQKDAYVQIAENVKYNIETQQVSIFAKSVRKTVLIEGVYPIVKQQKKTIAKDFIKKEMKSSKYRMFVISQINEIKINGDIIEIS